MSETSNLISVVDDDPSMSRMLCRVIKAAGLSVDAFGSAEEFLDSDASRKSVCLILDMNLPGMSGLELQERLHASRVEVPIIFMSAQADDVTQRRALKAGAFGFLRKPFSIESLLATLRSIPLASDAS
jgi:FixJ family two-component response regulator